jgi:hypothetical protein
MDTITVTPLGGFTGSVTLSASGLPAGVTASFATNPTTASSALTLAATASAAAGAYNVTVTGVSNALTASTPLSLTIGGCTSTPIIPYLQLNTDFWQQISTATVAAGTTVNLGPQPNGAWDGTWSWSGPGGFTSNQRGIFGIPLSPGANTFVVTYINDTSCASTQSFVITE